jgi:hypothetical protein
VNRRPSIDDAVAGTDASSSRRVGADIAREPTSFAALA